MIEVRLTCDDCGEAWATHDLPPGGLMGDRVRAGAYRDGWRRPLGARGLRYDVCSRCYAANRFADPDFLPKHERESKPYVVLAEVRRFSPGPQPLDDVGQYRIYPHAQRERAERYARKLAATGFVAEVGLRSEATAFGNAKAYELAKARRERREANVGT